MGFFDSDSSTTTNNFTTNNIDNLGAEGGSISAKNSEITITDGGAIEAMGSAMLELIENSRQNGQRALEQAAGVSDVAMEAVTSLGASRGAWTSRQVSTVGVVAVVVGFVVVFVWSKK